MQIEGSKIFAGVFFVPTKNVLQSYHEFHKRELMRCFLSAYMMMRGGGWGNLDKYSPNLAECNVISRLSPEILEECFGPDVGADDIKSEHKRRILWGRIRNKLFVSQGELLTQFRDRLKDTPFGGKFERIKNNFSNIFLLDVKKIYWFWQLYT